MLVQLKYFDKFKKYTSLDFDMAFRIDYNISSVRIKENHMIYCDNLKILYDYTSDDYEIISSKDIGNLLHYCKCELLTYSNSNFQIVEYDIFYYVLLAKNKKLSSKLKLLMCKEIID